MIYKTQIAYIKNHKNSFAGPEELSIHYIAKEEKFFSFYVLSSDRNLKKVPTRERERERKWERREKKKEKWRERKKTG